MFGLFGKNRKWQCLKCKNLNRSDALFCEFCGSPKNWTPESERSIPEQDQSRAASVRCPACDALCDGNAQFCSECGFSLKKKPADTVPVMRREPLPPVRDTRIRCVHCGEPNDADMRFCKHCGKEARVAEKKAAEQPAHGQRSGITCPECGAVNTAELVFCDSCGARLDNSRGYNGQNY